MAGMLELGGCAPFAEDDDFFAEVAGFVPLAQGFFAVAAGINVGGVERHCRRVRSNRQTWRRRGGTGR